MMGRHALEYTGERFRFNRVVLRDYFVVLAVLQRGNAYMRTTLSCFLITQAFRALSNCVAEISLGSFID